MHRKTVLIAAALVLLVVPILFYRVFFSPGDGGGQNAGEIVLAHDKGNIPGFQRVFERQGEKAARETGVGFVPEASPSTDLFINRMKAVLPTREAPALFTWWSSWRMRALVEKDLVNDLTHLWDRHKDDYPQEIRDAYTLDGKVYGIPYSVEYWPVWYNKPLFERLGIKAPETWDEFIHACEVLKAEGIDPVLASFQADWYSIIWFAQMIIGQDPDFYVRLCEGEASYSDPAVKQALDVYGDMIQKGYFSFPSANMFTNAGYLWNNERFGMVLCGAWYYQTVLIDQGVDADTIGLFILPPHNPSAEKTIMMESGPVLSAKNALNQKEAEIIMDWWLGPAGSSHFSEAFGVFPASNRIDPDYLTPVRKDLFYVMKEENTRIVNRYWEATPPPIVDAAIRSLSAFILHPENKRELMDELTAAARQYWDGQEKGE